MYFTPFFFEPKIQINPKTSKYSYTIFPSVILLSSTSADERVDSQICGTKLRYLENGQQEKNVDFQNLGWIEMERKLNFPSRATHDQEEINESLFLPSSGYTKSFFLKCNDPNKEYNGFFAALLMFASEGDNTGDAIQLVSYLNNWKKLLPPNDRVPVQPKLQFPVSWQALFGNAPPKIIF